MSRESSDCLSKVGQRRQVVLPLSVFERLGLEIGDYVQFEVQGSDVVVRARRLVPIERPIAPRSREDRLRLLEKIPAPGSEISAEKIRASRTVSPPPEPMDE
ncbi:MAG: AbrB/MazE/SpoVT family DNA-binding domain-containing protein [Acidobacteria bacterium]|nr:AbrB/MazE/SpoVT family DNA-binding domain-containing protein [Acidobacteriota bacterium]MCG3193948.1 hypothetical protein [Thermoanaerobaculia bacterium]